MFTRNNALYYYRLSHTPDGCGEIRTSIRRTARGQSATIRYRRLIRFV